MSKLLLPIIALMVLPAATLAQGAWDVEPCPELDKKIAKLIDNSQDRKKYKQPERVQFLKDAIDADSECAIAHYYYGVVLYRNAVAKGSSQGPALEKFKAAIEACEGVHSDPYYYIGMWHMDKGNFTEAADYLGKFSKFNTEDEEKYARDYEKKLKQAKGALKWAEFFSDAYENPVPFNPVLVKNVSTADDEYLPLISPDNEKLFFTRKKEKKEEVRDAVYATDKISFLERFSEASGSGVNFDVGQPLPNPFNADEEYNYGGATIALDNREIFLTVCKMGVSGYVNCDIYTSRLTYGEPPYKDTHGEQWYWTELSQLGPNVNTPDGWEAQPSLSADGNTLYFASARADSRQIDIYKSDRSPDGVWGPCENLGEPINTRGNDKSPFMHSDSKTLYFASDGHMGFGGLDVYYVRQDNDGNWQEPENIGHPINTEKDEVGFVVSTDGRRVFFGSDKLKSKGQGGHDIFSFELHEKARPRKVVFIKANVTTETGEPMPDARLELRNTKTGEVAVFEADSTDGKVVGVQVIEEDAPVVATIKADDKAFNSQIITAENIAQKEAESKTAATQDITGKEVNQEKKLESAYIDLAEVKMEEVQVGRSYNLNDIYYSTNSAEITADSKLVLDEFIRFLQEYPGIKIAIHGHTDDKGDLDDNMALSTDRAFSVMEYLQEQSISSSRLSFKGFGPTKPIAPNTTEEGRAKNRRTEFLVTGK